MTLEMDGELQLIEKLVRLSKCANADGVPVEALGCIGTWDSED